MTPHFKNMELQIERLKDWASERKIMLVEGVYEKSKSPIVEIPCNNEFAIDTFMQMSDALGVKVIIQDLFYLDSETFELYENTLKEINDDEITEQFEKLKNFKDKILGYVLYVFSNGMTFRFRNSLDEVSIYNSVRQEIFEYLEGKDSDTSNYKEITKEKAAELGKIFAEHEDYPKLKTRTQREGFCQEFFKVDFEKINVHDYYGAIVVNSHAETYYETKVKPQKEKELKLKITDLLNKGWTKVKIAAELKISKDTLNKFV